MKENHNSLCAESTHSAVCPRYNMGGVTVSFNNCPYFRGIKPWNKQLTKRENNLKLTGDEGHL